MSVFRLTSRSKDGETSERICVPGAQAASINWGTAVSAVALWQDSMVGSSGDYLDLDPDDREIAGHGNYYGRLPLSRDLIDQCTARRFIGSIVETPPNADEDRNGRSQHFGKVFERLRPFLIRYPGPMGDTIAEPPSFSNKPHSCGRIRTGQLCD